MKKCRYADKYKALRAPLCNGGEPCEVCRHKWRVAQLPRHLARIMTPAEWELALRRSALGRYLALERVVREECDRLAPGEEINTHQLVMRLCAEPSAKGTTYKRLMGMLLTRDEDKEGLVAPDCRHRGPARKRSYYGQVVQPWVWHNSTKWRTL